MFNPRIHYRSKEDGGNRRCSATVNIFISREKKKKGQRAYVVMMSWKSHMPSREAATPRTAEEIIWVMGEVTLMDKREAMDIRKPMMPCMRASFRISN